MVCAMKGLRVIALVAAAIATTPLAASAQTNVPRPQLARFMRVFAVTLPPYGFMEFCRRMPEECRKTTTEAGRLSLTPERLNELDTVNSAINREIEPASDMEMYGRSEYWTIPTTRGDCEDYALLKRKRLIERGWPASALLLTVVRDQRGEGHAVLTARTAQGDLILDNKADEVKLWYRTGYDYIMRQSFIDPHTWVSLDPTVATSNLAMAGAPSRR